MLISTAVVLAEVTLAVAEEATAAEEVVDTAAEEVVDMAVVEEALVVAVIKCPNLVLVSSNKHGVS